MTKKITILSILVLLVALVSYVFYLNIDSSTLTYAPNKSITAPLGLILIGIFLLGVIVTAAIFLLFLAWNKFQIHKLSKTISQEETHHTQIIKAREALATENFEEAKSILRKLNKKYPNDVLTRILLAQVHREENNAEEALRVLEEARAEQKENLELLYETAMAYAAKENFTAAYDNAMLMLKKAPFNKRALKLASSYAEEIGKLDEAIELQKTLAQITRNEEYEITQYTIAYLMFEKAEKIESEAEAKALYEKIIKEHKSFTPAYVSLASILAKTNKTAALKLLQRAYKIDAYPEIIENILEIYQDDDELAAVNAIRTLDAGSTSNDFELESRLILINFLMEKNKIDEAKDELQKIKANCDIPEERKRQLEVLESVSLNAFANIKEAKKAISEMVFETLL